MNIKKYLLDFYNDFKTNEQKRNHVLIVFLVFIGVCSVFVGFFNTKQTIKNPFIDKDEEAIDSIYSTYNKLKAQGKIKDDTATVSDSTTTNTKTSSDSASKTTDTDGDGISDYDEVNIFKTSAFLADSDGDGISDYDEIKAGTDANCPTGKDCSADITNTNTNTSTTNNGSVIYNGVDVNKMDIAKARIELEKIIPESLKPMLANMTDDQVRSLVSQLYDGTVSQGDTQTNTNTTNNTNNTSVVNSDYQSVLKSKLPQFTAAQISTMKDMSEADIKKILLDSNIADEALLSKFKTGELKTTVLGE